MEFEAHHADCLDIQWPQCGRAFTAPPANAGAGQRNLKPLEGDPTPRLAEMRRIAETQFRNGIRGPWRAGPDVATVCWSWSVPMVRLTGPPQKRRVGRKCEY